MVTLATGSADGNTQLWSLRSDTLEQQQQQQQQQLAEGKLALSKKGCRQQRQGAYVIAAEGDVLLVCTATDLASSDPSKPAACFRAPGKIDVFACAGDQIAVGCESGEVVVVRGALLAE